LDDSVAPSVVPKNIGRRRRASSLTREGLRSHSATAFPSSIGHRAGLSALFGQRGIVRVRFGRHKAHRRPNTFIFS